MSKKPQTEMKKKAAPSAITDEAIAARAHVKWRQRGCPLWDQDQDWFEARTELEQELARDETQTASMRPAMKAEATRRR